MSTTIQIKRSSTASAIPVTGDIAVGELAVNLADKRLYTKQSDGTIIELSTNPTDLDAATLRIDGVEITASATELNSLDGFTGSTTELNLLDGLTATTIELNTLDGITASTAELNKLDGYTGSTAELNILDGVTATTVELNYTDGVTSNIQTQLNGKATTAQGALADSAVQPDDNVSFGTGDFSGAVTVTSTITADEVDVIGTITANAANITGTVTADGLEVNLGSNGNYMTVGGDDSSLGRGLTFTSYSNAGGTGAGHIINAKSSAGQIKLQTQNLNRLLLAENGDVSFYEDTGTTAKMVWDASAEKARFGGTTDDFSGSIGLDGSTFRIDGYLNNSLVINAKPNAINEGVILQYNGNDGLILNNAGNVGIGTPSPSTKLDINGGTVYPKVKIQASSNTSRFMQLGMDNATEYSIEANGAGTNLLFKTVGSERARIDSSGRLGIGTASPNEKLQVDGNIRIGDTATGINDNEEYSITSGGQLIISANDAASDTSYTGLILNAGKSGGAAASSSAVVLQTNNTERARIDSSGNLLVGKTSASTYNISSGFEAQSDGLVAATRTSGAVQILNRLSTDGDIAIFRKDGSTVGSIGVDNSDNLYITGNSSHAGLMCGSTEILPYKGTTLNDGVNDIGSSSFRWKDLYLSGGVYLGGTGAVNKLDDYEEGTFTPTFLNIIAPTYVSQNGKYVKIGSLVYIEIEISVTGLDTADSSGAAIGGLPFSVAGTDSASSAFLMAIDRRLSTVIASGKTITSGAGTFGSFVTLSDDVTANYTFYNSHFNASGDLYLTGTYRAA